MSDRAEVGRYEGEVGDLCIDVGEGAGKLMDEMLAGENVEVEQVLVAVLFRRDDGTENYAWKPLYGGRWASSSGLMDAVRENLRRELG